MFLVLSLVDYLVVSISQSIVERRDILLVSLQRRGRWPNESLVTWISIDQHSSRFSISLLTKYMYLRSIMRFLVICVFCFLNLKWFIGITLVLVQLFIIMFEWVWSQGYVSRIIHLISVAGHLLNRLARSVRECRFTRLFKQWWWTAIFIDALCFHVGIYS